MYFRSFQFRIVRGGLGTLSRSATVKLISECSRPSNCELEKYKTWLYTRMLCAFLYGKRIRLNLHRMFSNFESKLEFLIIQRYTNTSNTRVYIYKIKYRIEIGKDKEV